MGGGHLDRVVPLLSALGTVPNNRWVGREGGEKGASACLEPRDLLHSTRVSELSYTSRNKTIKNKMIY